MGLPWLGYLVGGLFTHIMRQSLEDVIALSIETGVQNTGIAIFMLRYTLDQPLADLTTGMYLFGLMLRELRLETFCCKEYLCQIFIPYFSFLWMRFSCKILFFPPVLCTLHTAESILT